MLAVVKRSGVTEPFSREKVVSGVRRACQGRPVTEGDLAVLLDEPRSSLDAGDLCLDAEAHAGAHGVIAA